MSNVNRQDRYDLERQLSDERMKNLRLQTELDELRVRISMAERVERTFNEAPDLSFADCLELFPDEIRNIQSASGRSGFIEGYYAGRCFALENESETLADQYVAKLYQEPK